MTNPGTENISQRELPTHYMKKNPDMKKKRVHYIARKKLIQRPTDFPLLITCIGDTYLLFTLAGPSFLYF